LHTDRTFLLAALDTTGFFPRFSGWLRWQASPELCADYDFLLKMLAKAGAALLPWSNFKLRFGETSKIQWFLESHFPL
jgi:hypothetical protein